MVSKVAQGIEMVNIIQDFKVLVVSKGLNPSLCTRHSSSFVLCSMANNLTYNYLPALNHQCSKYQKLPKLVQVSLFIFYILVIYFVVVALVLCISRVKIILTQHIIQGILLLCLCICAQYMMSEMNRKLYSSPITIQLIAFTNRETLPLPEFQPMTLR